MARMYGAKRNMTEVIVTKEIDGLDTQTVEHYYPPIRYVLFGLIVFLSCPIAIMVALALSYQFFR